VKETSVVAPWWTLFRGFLRAPRSVGSIAPSSPRLADAMLDAARPEWARTVVEFGPGTGALTGAIIHRLRSDARLLAFEVDTKFVANLRSHYRDARVTFVAACATESPRYLARFGTPTADCVVSSLPLSVLPRPLTHRIMEAALDCLRPGGIFVTYQFTTALARPILQDYFPEVRRTRFVMRNFPPAMVFACRKPPETAQPQAPELCLVGDAAY